jgi:hypothetical protein
MFFNIICTDIIKRLIVTLNVCWRLGVIYCAIYCCTQVQSALMLIWCFDVLPWRFHSLNAYICSSIFDCCKYLLVGLHPYSTCKKLGQQIQPIRHEDTSPCSIMLDVPLHANFIRAFAERIYIDLVARSAIIRRFLLIHNWIWYHSRTWMINS